MSYPSERLGGQAFNHQQSSSAEQEYERLRQEARDELGRYHHFASEAQKAYNKGDGQSAHQASEEAKRHARLSDQKNTEASEFIFRENNAVGKVGSDTIDLHGQYVEEAEAIVKQRIAYAQETHQTHLHIIVGKGNHSPGHIQKIKPAVEEVCRERNLQFHPEHNEGRIYVDLTGGPAVPPTTDPSAPAGYEPQTYGQAHYPSAYPQGEPQYSWSQGAQQQGFDWKEAARQGKKYLPLAQQIFRSCCIVM